MTGASAAAKGFGDGAMTAENDQQAASWSAPVLQQGGTVLVKGSRSAGMEAVVQRLIMGAGPQKPEQGAH